ncbi:signal peptidase I [Candidatus Dependentiae bacterium]
MEDLKERWNHIRSKYATDRAHFVKIARRWEFDGWHRAAKHIRESLKEADEICKKVDSLLRSKKSVEREQEKIVEKCICKLEYAYKDLSWSTNAIWKQWTRIGGAASLVILFISFVGFPRFISSRSCSPVLMHGDVVWEDSFSASFGGIRHGDVVSFHSPDCVCGQKRSWLRKLASTFGLPGACKREFGRIVALGGESVEGCVQCGDCALLVNGQKFELNFLNDVSEECDLENGLDGFEVKIPGLAFSEDVFEKVVVPKGCCWIMSDSRSSRRDSRKWGPLPVKNIHGKVGRVLFSFLPKFFGGPKLKARWNRVFKNINV